MIKEKLVALMQETDEVLQLDLLEELVLLYNTTEVTDEYKVKYEELHKRYIKTFLEGTEVEEVEEELVEEVEEENIDDITIEELFEEEKENDK